MPDAQDPSPITPAEALERLVKGNERFMARAGSATQRWRPELAKEGQSPFAIVLGCSDSRTPVEIVFDQGFGELFVVRVAGGIVAPSIIGSIEFAAMQFGTSLVVVLGHSWCGAVGAAVRAVQTGQGPESKNIRSITDYITPHVEDLVRAAEGADPAKLLRHAIRANVRHSAAALRHGSRILEDLVDAGRLAVVGAEYELETGRVLLLEDARPGAP